MDLCENCHGMLDNGSVELEDGRLLCAICNRQWEEEARCDFLYDKQIEDGIREGSIE